MILKQAPYTFNKEEVTLGMTLGCRRASLVLPDDFAVLTGDVKLEHIPTLRALYELKRNLRSEKRGNINSTPGQTLMETLQHIQYTENVPTKHMQSVQVAWQTATDNPFSKLVLVI